jgi:branched-chain amino acid aminotransferase
MRPRPPKTSDPMAVWLPMAGGIMPAARLARILGDDRPGPISSPLNEAFWAKRAGVWYATPIDYKARETDA